MKNFKGFSMIELLVVIAIIAIIFLISIPLYQNFVESSKCNTYKDQHKKVVDLANVTYNLCRLNGETYMNVPPGFGCRSQSNSGMTAISGGGSVKCTRKWDCSSDWAGRSQNAGLSSGWFFSHVNAEFGMYPNTDSFVRNDQWKNFLNPGYPERPGITNVREKGVNMHIATYLGPNCKKGDLINSGGAYMIDEIVWP
tara:strand:- start:67 stop:657 length:591 start_codon:yes stop_codon:yes gene_type:complete